MFEGVSTILPVYLQDPKPAAECALLRAAESVLSQECDLALELLIVDDGSRPDLRSMPGLGLLLQDPRVRMIRLEQNQGLVYAQNAGLTQARYDLIARIDQDDLWRSGKLRRQLECLRSDPDLTLVATGMRLVHPEDRGLDRDEHRGGTWSDALDFFGRVGCPFPHGSVLARREVFDILGGYPHAPEFTHCDDYALWGAWIRFFKTATLDEILFEYTISGDQISSRFAGQQRRGSGIVRQRFSELGDALAIPAAISAIATGIEANLYDASRILCSAWMHYEGILVDSELYEAARIVFPDRKVRDVKHSGELNGKRYFNLQRRIPERR